MIVAETLTFDTQPDSGSFVVGAANVATRLDIPPGPDLLSLFFATDPGQLAFRGEDGVAIDATAVPQPANNWWEFRLDKVPQRKRVASVFVATAVGGTTVAWLLE